MTLSTQRKSIHPQTNDDWSTIAARELSGQPLDTAVSQLQSWNLHVFMRPTTEGAARAGNTILPSDVIFLEPPR